MPLSANPAAAGPLTGSTLTLAGGNLLIRSDAAVTYNAGGGRAPSRDGLRERHHHRSAGEQCEPGMSFSSARCRSATNPSMLANDASVTSGDVDLRFSG